MSNELKERLICKTPKWFQVIIKWALIIAGGAAAGLVAEAAIPGFQMHWLTSIILKNLVFTGLIVAGVAKTAKETSKENENNQDK